MSLFDRKLRALGHPSYEAYLRSGHWKAFRARYYSSREAGPVGCAVCGRATVSLHHVTYARLGRERLTDVVPLCAGHHGAVHEWLAARSLPVENTHQAVAALARPPRRSTYHKPRRRRGRDGG